MYSFPSLRLTALEEMITFYVLSQWEIILAQNVKTTTTTKPAINHLLPSSDPYEVGDWAQALAFIDLV